MSEVTIPTREQIAALPEAEFRSLHGSVISSWNRRTAHRRLRDDSAAAKLSELDVGESILFPTWQGADRLTSVVKDYARRRLEQPAANWTARTTNQGVRVTRVC